MVALSLTSYKKINYLTFLDHLDAVSISGAPAVAVTCCFSESSVETRHHLNMIQVNTSHLRGKHLLSLQGPSYKR